MPQLFGITEMKFFAILCFLVVAAPAALFVAGRDNGPIAFALLQKCQQRFKCTVREQLLPCAIMPALYSPTAVLISS
jgi:hypothetical protein